MINHAANAKQMFIDGYNCAQAVFCAFCDVHGMDMDEAARISSSFGGGMGRLREVCGALSGAFMVVGMLYGGYDVKDRAAKTRHYEIIQELAKKFQGEYGTLMCRGILGLPDGPSNPEPEVHTPEYLKTRPCPGCVEYAARILDEFLNENNL